MAVAMPHRFHPRFLLAMAALTLLSGAACDDESAAGGRAPGLWVAYPASVFGEPGPIHLVHAESGQGETIGAPGTYHSVTWSPKADRIAVVRAGATPELVVMSTVDSSPPMAAPLASPETALYWSPDGVRIAAVSTDSVLMLTTGLEVAARFELPEGLPATGEVGEGLWSDTGQQFAVPYRGYVLVAGASGRWTLLDPADFVRRPGETIALTVMDWAEGALLAIFEEAAGGAATRYVMDMTEDPPRLASSSDYPGGAGPMDGLVAEASEAAGGREVLVGRRGQPAAARWVVAEPRAPGGAPEVYVRPDEHFRQILAGRFAGADASAIAADLSLLVLEPPGGR
jgi:hypothetical protein